MVDERARFGRVALLGRHGEENLGDHGLDEPVARHPRVDEELGHRVVQAEEDERLEREGRQAALEDAVGVRVVEDVTAWASEGGQDRVARTVRRRERVPVLVVADRRRDERVVREPHRLAVRRVERVEAREGARADRDDGGEEEGRAAARFLEREVVLVRGLVEAVRGEGEVVAVAGEGESRGRVQGEERRGRGASSGRASVGRGRGEGLVGIASVAAGVRDPCTTCARERKRERMRLTSRNRAPPPPR